MALAIKRLLLPWVRRHGLLALAILALATIATRAILEKTGGEPAVPLDDAFIHFQYARSFARLEPFAYTPGAEPTAGATSLFWPLVLAPFAALGFEGTAMVWPAWVFGWLAFGMLAHETRRLAEGLVAPSTAIAAAAMVLCFGGYVWFAGSGMEVLPLAWVLTRTARRVAEWGEAASGQDAAAATDARLRIELAVLGVLGPLMRPEGILCSALAAGALVVFPRGRSRCWAAVALAGPFVPGAVYWMATGAWTTTTALVKWLPSSPYYQGTALLSAIGSNLRLLFGTLLDGQIWSAVFLPRGGGFIACLALVAIPALGWLRRRTWRAAAVLVVACGMFIPTTYDSFLWNRLRYLWPFAAAWFVGLAALSELVGMGIARLRRDLEPVKLLIAGSFVGAFASHLSWSIDDLATSADAIRRQQVALGRWARDELPADSVLGVNDTGAIAYFSGRKVFDIVGLTTSGQARYWTAGAGSRFEHYERMDRSKLPTHFIVYPEWMRVSPLLGDYITERSVPGATILGGTTMVAHVATYRALGAATVPRDLPPGAGALRDELDVTHLESEAAHGYELLQATQWTNVVVGAIDAADGARSSRTLDRFNLDVAPGDTLVARVGASEPMTLAVRVDGAAAGELALEGLAWEEPSLELDVPLAPGRRRLEVRAPEGKTFTSMCYWSYGAE